MAPRSWLPFQETPQLPPLSPPTEVTIWPLWNQLCSTLPWQKVCRRLAMTSQRLSSRPRFTYRSSTRRPVPFPSPNARNLRPTTNSMLSRRDSRASVAMTVWWLKAIRSIRFQPAEAPRAAQVRTSSDTCKLSFSLILGLLSVLFTASLGHRISYSGQPGGRCFQLRRIRSQRWIRFVPGYDGTASATSRITPFEATLSRFG